MTDSSDPIRLDQQLCFALYHASRALIRAYGPLLEPLGLTYPQYLVMLVLWAEKTASVKELGQRLALDSGTLTPLLKRLEQSGLVSRRRDPADERVVQIEITAQGRDLQAKARNVPVELVCRLGMDVGDAQERLRFARLRQELVELAERIERSGAIGGQ
jgi:MarR family transcriptional regulator, organic hydroperoxide resistance regulator